MTTLCFAMALINSTVLFLVSAIHIYWALGGKTGMASAVPSNENGERMLNPGRAACVIVALCLAGFAILFLDRVALLQLTVPSWASRYGVIGISIIFLLRAFGDFRCVGFTKKIKRTTFGMLDTKYYSPLCLFIGLNGIVLEILLKTLPKI